VNAFARLRDRYRVSADPLRTERRVELGVIALATVLLLQLVWAGTRMLLAGDVAPMTPAADSLIVAEVPRPQSVDAEDSAAVQARPLFWAERRPLEVVASTPAEDELVEKNERAAPRMKNVTLLGVFGSGRTGGAIVAVKGRQERVAVGERVQDWRLQEVAANSAVFVSGGARDERELLPRVIAPPVDAAGNAVAPAGGQGGGADADADDEERRLSLGGR